MTLSGGNFTLDCQDDAIHSNADVTIAGGTYQIATGDDGVHADENAVISDGTIVISASYEGIEGQRIEISGGEIDVTASDDGLNAAGSDSGGDARRGFMQSSGNNELIISGGYIVIDAAGDGLDSDGNLTVTGGNVLICANDADERKNKSTYGSALYCKSMKVTGGSLKVCSKIHETEKTFVRDSRAIVCKAFTKNYYRVKVKLPKNSNTVKVDGKTVYKGAGYTVSFDSVSHTYTDKKDKYAYIWVKKGTHKISVNGKFKKVTKSEVI